MIKFKKYLSKIKRLQNPLLKNTPDYLRLNRSERAINFEKDHFNRFIETISQEDIMSYPNTRLLNQRIAKDHNLNENQVFITPGSDVAIKTFFEISVGARDEVIITDPCFPMYNVYGALFACKLNKIGYDQNLKLDSEKLINSINKNVSLVAIANPTSPIGDFLDVNMISEIAKKCHKFSIPFVIDEAYFEFAPGSSEGLISKFDNIAIIRTFSKAHGAAGLRIGYVLADKSIIDVLSKWRLMYEVNQIGIKFGCFTLDNKKVTERYAQSVIDERNNVSNYLRKKGVYVINSHANWIHMHFNDKQKQVVKILERNKVLFKSDTKIPFDSREDFIRISICPNMMNMKFFTEISRLLN